MEQFVVTIARQFGSLGRPVAKELAKKLEVEYYDRDIVEAAAEKLGLPVSAIDAQEEKANNFFRMALPLGRETKEIQDNIFVEQTAIIRSFAIKSSCVIVGRCSDYVLEYAPNSLHIFVYASYEQRLQNCIDALRLDLITARKLIGEVDKARDAYHRRYAGFLPGDMNHKDLMINSALLGVEKTADYLAELVRKRFG